MAKRMSRASRKAYVSKRRRACWNHKCQFCDYRWRESKWNVLCERSSSCAGCLLRLNRQIARGAAWIARRRATIGIWDATLEQALGLRKRRKSA